MSFQDKIQNLITDNNTLSKKNDLSYYINDFQDRDIDFLITELEEYQTKNYPYLRNLYTIIIALWEKWKDLNSVLQYLYSQLFENNNLKIGTVEIYTKLYIQLSNDSNIINVKKLYDLQKTKDIITISTIENYSKYFSINEKSQYFIDSFFYNKSDWFRARFLAYKLGYHSDNQKWVLELDRTNFYKFLDKLSENDNLKSFVSHIKNSDYKNDFTQEIIDKWMEFWNYNKMYDFLISIIKYSNSSSWRYYRENVYYNQIQEFLLQLKSKVDFWDISFFQKLFNDINYNKKWFYYFRELEEFFSKILKNKQNIDEFLKVDKVIENNYILAFRIYQLLEVNKNKKLCKYIENIIWDSIKENNERQQLAIDENNKYRDKIKQEDLQEIEENVLSAENKKFVPNFIDDFINKSVLLNDEYFNKYEINNLIKNQLEYFCKWDNLNPWNKDWLKWFKKTENWYNGFSLLFDNDLILNVLKTAKIIGFDLSEYSLRLSYYIPFITWNEELLNELFHFCWLNEIENIFNIYKNYPVIAWFNPRNLIQLYSEKKSIILENNKLNQDILSFLKDWIFEYNNWFYNKEKILRFLQDNWESEQFFLQIFEKYKSDFNHFITESTSTEEYQNFKLAEVANEILIIYWNFDALKWRIEQIKNWLIENREFKNWIQHFSDEINFRDDKFIECFCQIKDNDKNILDLFIQLIKDWFDKYSETTSNYSYYIWRAIQYYFSWLDKISDEKYLIDEISKIISDSEKLDAIVYFKRHVDELEWGLFLERINTLIEKNKTNNYYYDKIISEQDEIVKEHNKYKNLYFQENILIHTEWPTDYQHFKNANKNLLTLWMIKTDYFHYFKSQENTNSVNWSCCETYIYLKKISQIFDKKCVIWIFDNDDLSFLKNEKEVYRKEFNDNWYFSINNLHIISLWIWNWMNHIDKIYNNKSCIELYYDEDFLVWKILTKKFHKDNYNKTILWVNNIYKKWKYFYNIKFDWICVCDKKSSLRIFDSKYDNVTNTTEWWNIQWDIQFISKTEFAKNIGKWIYNKVINIKVWKRFLPVFNKIDEIVWNYSINISKESFNNNIKYHKVTLIQKLFNHLKNFFK